jgi:glycosyltransferase involved in cell wall biosynthesis
VGTDLLPRLAAVTGTDVFGMRVDQLVPPEDDPGSLVTFEDLPQDAMHAALARRRVYVHTARWTSLGLSLLEAMHLGMPVVAVGSTEAFRAVPPEAGVVTSHVPELLDGVRRLLADPELCAAMGAAGRAHALEHYGLDRFLSDWDAVLDRVVSGW